MIWEKDYGAEKVFLSHFLLMPCHKRRKSRIGNFYQLLGAMFFTIAIKSFSFHSFLTCPMWFKREKVSPMTTSNLLEVNDFFLSNQHFLLGIPSIFKSTIEKSHDTHQVVLRTVIRRRISSWNLNGSLEYEFISNVCAHFFNNLLIHFSYGLQHHSLGA